MALVVKMSREEDDFELSEQMFNQKEEIDFAANLAQGDEGGMTPLSELPPIPAEGSHTQDESAGGDTDVQ